MKDKDKPFFVKQVGIRKPEKLNSSVETLKPNLEVCVRCGKEIREVYGQGFGKDVKPMCGCPPWKVVSKGSWGC